MCKDKIPDLDFQLTSTPIVSHPERQLKTNWKVEKPKLYVIGLDGECELLEDSIDPLKDLKKLIKKAKRKYKNDSL